MKSLLIYFVDPLAPSSVDFALAGARCFPKSTPPEVKCERLF